MGKNDSTTLIAIICPREIASEAVGHESQTGRTRRTPKALVVGNAVDERIGHAIFDRLTIGSYKPGCGGAARG
jgi:hypothetical protein